MEAATSFSATPAPGQAAAQLWHGALARLSVKLSMHVFQTWFLPVVPVGLEGTTLVLGVPHLFHADWLKNHYPDILHEELRKDLAGAHFKCLVMPELEVPSAPASLAPLALTRAQVAQPAPPPAGVTVPPPARVNTHFNPRLTFDAFVTGPSNQLAVAAAKAVANNPGQQYNPLFIFGAVGLGKTHLLQAVGQQVQRTRGQLNVLSLNAEDFTNEFLNSVQNGRMDAFRARYRAQCDVLLLDDVHFLAGKERTQEEFFHVFNHHHQLNRQVVLTSDRFPHEMHGMEERLRSRLNWGLIVDIQPPELETRMAIVRTKAAAQGVTIADDVVLFLASHIKSSVRELEGALTRVIAGSSVHGRPLDVALCKQELREQVLRARTPTCEEIQKHVCSYYSSNLVEMRGTKRSRAITTPRHVAMYLCRKHTQASFPEIGAAFGGKDHTTVMASVRKVEGLLKEDGALVAAVTQLGRILEA